MVYYCVYHLIYIAIPKKIEPCAQEVIEIFDTYFQVPTFLSIMGLLFTYMHAYRHSDIQTGRHTGRQTDIQTDRHTDIQADRHTDT